MKKILFCVTICGLFQQFIQQKYELEKVILKNFNDCEYDQKLDLAISNVFIYQKSKENFSLDCEIEVKEQFPEKWQLKVMIELIIIINK